jgi:hypothetical protein
MSEREAQRNGDASSQFESLRTLDVVIDEQGDTTPRPPREALRRHFARRGLLQTAPPASATSSQNGDTPTP